MTSEDGIEDSAPARTQIFAVKSVKDQGWFRRPRRKPPGPPKDDLGDQEDPGSDPVYKAPHARNPDRKRAVRRHLALAVIWVLLGTYALAIGSFVVVHFLPPGTVKYDATDLTAAIAGISGIQGLAAAIVGFFFGQKHRENRDH